MRWVLVAGWVAVPALAQQGVDPAPVPPPPPMVQADPLREPDPLPAAGFEWADDLPVEAQRETPEARSAARLAFSATFGIVGDPGSSGTSSTGTPIGPSLIVAKPFYMGTRYRAAQFLWDARITASWAPVAKFAVLQMSPMWGVNFYFGSYVGMELRLGVGFAARFSNNSHFGVSGAGDSALVFRPFKDDRMRIKALAGAGMQLYLDGASAGGLSAYLGAGFELPL
ncbi:MAG: hypothetical protein IPJ65_25680 [Archangiaceae bacterium]|nr:hypothetical protein [Archangiaceae bacterium]